MTEISFEKAMERIEEIVKDLESGELPLDEALDRFEEAVKLARMCQQRLDKAQARISKLVKTGDDGFALEPFGEPSED